MIVQTKNGKIRGIENISPIGAKKYHSFLGIPYAKPPIGDLRFSVSTLIFLIESYFRQFL